MTSSCVDIIAVRVSHQNLSVTGVNLPLGLFVANLGLEERIYTFVLKKMHHLHFDILDGWPLQSHKFSFASFHHCVL